MLKNPFLESLGDKPGSKWRIRVIEAGISLNQNYYSDRVLKEATSLFNGVRVFVKPDAEHLKGSARSFTNLIGGLSEATFIEGKTLDTGEIQATFSLLQSAGEVSSKLLEAYERGMTDLFGFSITADGEAVPRADGSRECRKITHVESVDLIVQPAAGGELLNLIEATMDVGTVLLQLLLDSIKTNAPDLLENLDTNDPQAILAAYQQVGSGKEKPPATEPVTETKATEAVHVTKETVLDAVRLIENRVQARLLITESKLPAEAKNRLVKHFTSDTKPFTEAEVKKAIQEEAAYLAPFTESGKPNQLGETTVSAGEGQADKYEKMLDDFFSPPKNGRIGSFKECYRQLTGDTRVTGQLRECTRFAEATGLTSTSFINVLGNSITRRMLAEYSTDSAYDVWRSLVVVTNVGDFRTQERTRWGGYGDLPAVSEGAAYAGLTSPTDEKTTYAATKRGGTENITLEMIKNDDSGVIAQIPIKLGRAAKRTLGKFVLDFLVTNPTIYDSLALFHASHGNLGSTTLSKISFAAARLAFLKQTETGSNAQLGIPPTHLWLPFDLEETAYNLFVRNTNLDPDFVATQQPKIHSVWYWTDVNNWYLSAEPKDIPTIEIGFLDGQQEPELFTQDMPNVGSLFSNDKITYKIRHIYGGNIMDYRGLYGAIVA